MKMICPHCQGSGIVDHMEVKTDGDSTFYKCIRCNRIANYEFVCDCHEKRKPDNKTRQLCQ